MKIHNNSDKDFAFEGTEIPAGGSVELSPELAGRLLALYWHNPLEPIIEDSEAIGVAATTFVEEEPAAKEENTMIKAQLEETPDVVTPETPVAPEMPAEPEEESEVVEE